MFVVIWFYFFFFCCMQEVEAGRKMLEINLHWAHAQLVCKI